MKNIAVLNVALLFKKVLSCYIILEITILRTLFLQYLMPWIFLNCPYLCIQFLYFKLLLSVEQNSDFFSLVC